MVYCARCGNQNPDNSEFCNKCGASLRAPMVNMPKQRDDRCEEECAGGRKGASVFWGILVVVIGIAVLFWALNEGGLMMPAWISSGSFVMLIGIIIALALVVTGISIIIRRQKGQ